MYIRGINCRNESGKRWNMIYAMLSPTITGTKAFL